MPAEIRVVDLEGPDRQRAVSVLEEGFVGIYRWHAKRTLRSVTAVRAAEEAGRVVAVALLERLVPEVGYVYYLAVAREGRQKGIGGRLLDDALAGFARQGVAVVYGAVEEANRPSRRLFESRGFRLVERRELHWREGGLGAEGLRSRMWVVRGEVLYGRRLGPVAAPAAATLPRP